MAKVTFYFLNQENLYLGFPVDVTPAAVEDLRHFPETMHPPEGEVFDPGKEAMTTIEMLCVDREALYEKFDAASRRGVGMLIGWWLLWHQDYPQLPPREELHRRFGHEPLTVMFKRRHDTVGEMVLEWREIPPEGLKEIFHDPDTLTGWLQHFRRRELPRGPDGDKILELQRLSFVAGIHAIHHAHTREGGLPLAVLRQQYKDDPVVLSWLENHRAGHQEFLQRALPKRLHPSWLQWHDAAFWCGAEAALSLSLGGTATIDQIEEEAQGWRAKIVPPGTDARPQKPPDLDETDDTLRGRLALRIFRDRDFTEAVRRSPTFMTRWLDNLVGRGNWRFDTRQRSWLLRQVYPDGVSWAAINPTDSDNGWRALDPAEAASWWQRLAAGDTPMEMPLLTLAIKWLGDDRNLRREYQRIIGSQYHYKITRRQWQALIDKARRLAQRFHAANKFKCETGKDEFSDQLRKVADEPPFVLLHERLVTARLPYESGDCWIEWQRADGKVWGVLIMPAADGAYHAVVVHPDGRIELGCLLFDFRQPVVIRGGSTISEVRTGVASGGNRWQVLGHEYCRRWLYSEGTALDTLAKHAIVMLFNPLYGERPAELYGRDSVEQQEEIMARANIVGGVFRELLACCALAVTHVDDEPLTSHVTVTAAPFKARGKFHPPYEYKQITWRRPQELPRPRKIRRVVRSGGGLPLHKCSGHWRHRRQPNDICSLHPRACALAQWCSVKHPEKLWGHDDEPLCENDYQICVRCKRARWWVKDHERGSAAHGIVDKSYRIVASTGRRRRPP